MQGSWGYGYSNNSTIPPSPLFSKTPEPCPASLFFFNILNTSYKCRKWTFRSGQRDMVQDLYNIFIIIDNSFLIVGVSLYTECIYHLNKNHTEAMIKLKKFSWLIVYKEVIKSRAALKWDWYIIEFNKCSTIHWKPAGKFFTKLNKYKDINQFYVVDLLTRFLFC